MSQVQSTSYSTSTAASSSSTTSNSIASQDQFLKLLVAQLQAQDPLNPMDNAQMTTQLAQISTVEGVNKLNTTVTSMLDQHRVPDHRGRVELIHGAELVGTVDQLNATSMIGHTVLVEGDRMQLSYDDDGTAVAGGGVTLASAAANVKVEIKDANGNVVDTIDLGELDAGNHVFTWDGKSSSDATMTAGNYTFNVVATNNGKEVKATELNFGRVDAVLRDANGTLQLSLGGLGLYKQDDIRQLY
jgi:flagellar basal-body rod modification protein FlgD